LNVPFELRGVAVRLYEKFISNFRNTRGCSEEINYNIGSKKGFPLSPTLFGIYINKLEDCLEDAGCVGLTLTSIVIILIYVDDIFIMEKSTYDLCKQLITIKDIFYSMGMTMNTEKTKVMIIESKRITYDYFFL
jgi:hypothetical protein